MVSMDLLLFTPSIFHGGSTAVCEDHETQRHAGAEQAHGHGRDFAGEMRWRLWLRLLLEREYRGPAMYTYLANLATYLLSSDNALTR